MLAVSAVETNGKSLDPPRPFACLPRHPAVGFGAMRVFAIADLHLGFSTGKWMDRFGDHWRGHADKVEDSWRKSVGASDLVLLPGDFSWAMKPEEVAVEMEWLAALPGRKVLVKGNHDYWWPKSQAKLDALLPEGVVALKKRAAVIDGLPIVGVRGGDFTIFEETPADEREAALARIDATLEREERELRASIDHLETLGGGSLPPVALFHYPPFPIGESESRFTRILETLGCSWCVFGHLHSEPEWNAVFQGDRGGVRYRLVACDALDFRLLELDPIDRRADLFPRDDSPGTMRTEGE
jgi:predicted phosphohydrolase